MYIYIYILLLQLIIIITITILLLLLLLLIIITIRLFGLVLGCHVERDRSLNHNNANHSTINNHTTTTTKNNNNNNNTNNACTPWRVVCSHPFCRGAPLRIKRKIGCECWKLLRHSLHRSSRVAKSSAGHDRCRDRLL